MSYTQKTEAIQITISSIYLISVPLIRIMLIELKTQTTTVGIALAFDFQGHKSGATRVGVRVSQDEQPSKATKAPALIGIFVVYMYVG